MKNMMKAQERKGMCKPMMKTRKTAAAAVMLGMATLGMASAVQAANTAGSSEFNADIAIQDLGSCGITATILENPEMTAQYTLGKDGKLGELSGFENKYHKVKIVATGGEMCTINDSTFNTESSLVKKFGRYGIPTKNGGHYPITLVIGELSATVGEWDGDKSVRPEGKWIRTKSGSNGAQGFDTPFVGEWYGSNMQETFGGPLWTAVKVWRAGRTGYPAAVPGIDGVSDAKPDYIKGATEAVLALAPAYELHPLDKDGKESDEAVSEGEMLSASTTITFTPA